MDQRRIRHRLASLCLAAAASLPLGGCVAGGRSRWAPVDTPLAAAEVLDPVGSDRTMPTDR